MNHLFLGGPLDGKWIESNSSDTIVSAPGSVRYYRTELGPFIEVFTLDANPYLAAEALLKGYLPGERVPISPIDIRSTTTNQTLVAAIDDHENKCGVHRYTLVLPPAKQPRQLPDAAANTEAEDGALVSDLQPESLSRDSKSVVSGRSPE